MYFIYCKVEISRQQTFEFASLAVAAGIGGGVSSEAHIALLAGGLLDEAVAADGGGALVEALARLGAQHARDGALRARREDEVVRVRAGRRVRIHDVVVAAGRALARVRVVLRAPVVPELVRGDHVALHLQHACAARVAVRRPGRVDEARRARLPRARAAHAAHCVHVGRRDEAEPERPGRPRAVREQVRQAVLLPAPVQ